MTRRILHDTKPRVRMRLTGHHVIHHLSEQRRHCLSQICNLLAVQRSHNTSDGPDDLEQGQGASGLSCTNSTEDWPTFSGSSSSCAAKTWATSIAVSRDNLSRCIPHYCQASGVAALAVVPSRLFKTLLLLPLRPPRPPAAADADAASNCACRASWAAAKLP